MLCFGGWNFLEQPSSSYLSNSTPLAFKYVFDCRRTDYSEMTKTANPWKSCGKMFHKLVYLIKTSQIQSNHCMLLTVSAKFNFCSLTSLFGDVY